jgi:hypothetical protein
MDSLEAMKALRKALQFWKKVFSISWGRSRPTLKRLPFYATAVLIAYFWHPGVQQHVLLSLIAVPLVWAATMLAYFFVVPSELCSLSMKQRNLETIARGLKELYDKANTLAALPGDVSDEVAAQHLLLIEQWRSEAKAAVSEYSLSESILFDTIATQHIRHALRYDSAKPKRDAHLAAVLAEMDRLRLIASSASTEAEKISQNIYANKMPSE